MSMEITGLNNEINKLNYSEIKKPETAKNEVLSAETPEKTENSKFDLPKDRYIPSDEEDSTSTGIYKVQQDKDGNAKLIFNAPKKEASKTDSASQSLSAGKGASAQKSESKGDDTEQCTTNTDSVDSEIEDLKQERLLIKSQINRASEDEDTSYLEQQLAQIESEINQKDNDSYRKQNAVVTK